MLPSAVSSPSGSSPRCPGVRAACGNSGEWGIKSDTVRLIVEHTGCIQDRNGLTNTRTTLTGFPVRLLMWNMPYHAEHHLYPAVPFHGLPALHRQIRGKLAHIAPSYRAANRAVIQSL